jgi:hypothetical protein
MGRVVLAAFLMELALFAIAVPLHLSAAGRLNLYVIPPVAPIATFAITVWLGRPIKAKFAMHGVLVGVIGTLMYVALTPSEHGPKSRVSPPYPPAVAFASSGVRVVTLVGIEHWA